MKLTFFKKNWQLPVSALFIYLVVATLLCSLGFWQLDRGKQKQQLLMRQQNSEQQQVINLNNLKSAELQLVEYKSLKVSGKYDDKHQFLIDNQVRDGQVGYYVVTPLIIKDLNLVVLVNRGWVKMNKDRNILPDISIKHTKVDIAGRGNHFPSVGIKLAGADIPSDGWPAVVQVINPEIIAQRLDYPVYNFQIELDEYAEQGYLRKWREQKIMPPEKHFAYAAQWFALATALTILVIWLGFKNND